MINDLIAPWWQSEIIVLDLEGTGAQHKEKEGIVEIAAILLANKKLTEDYYYKLINPGIEIPPMISRIHGLKNKDLVNEPFLETIQSDLLNFINDKILLGHNVQVDYRLLKIKIPDYKPPLILDTKKISKHFYMDQQKHGLDVLIEKFQVKDQLINLPVKRNRHSAFYDAYATGLVFLRMMEQEMDQNASLKMVADIGSINLEPQNNQTSLF